VSTEDAGYAQRLRERSEARWKRVLDVQRPYRWNLRRLDLRKTLDVGCGIGRNLRWLSPGSVGVDHNEAAVSYARDLGMTAYTVPEFHRSFDARHDRFDSLLFAHVLEHMTEGDAQSLVAEYSRYLRPGGRAVFITPQEAGYRTDPTHVRFVGFTALKRHAANAGMNVLNAYSFPFPRWVGTLFPYNEFVVVAQKR